MTDIYRAARHAREVLDYVDRFLIMNKAIREELVKDAIADLDKALAQPEQEPMSFQTWRSRQHGDPEEIGFLQALKHAYESGQYSVSPPRKEWVGLTDEQIAEIAAVSALKTPDDIYFARLIEAMLKEKNT